jgi:DNA-binding MarR family transcriptional regulator
MMGAVPPDRSRGTGAGDLGPVLEFMRLFWAVNHGYDSVSKRMAAVIGVTGPQRLVIRMIGRFPGISAGELAALLHSHPSTLTGVLGRLQRRRLIVRGQDPLDARRTRFHLTAAGRGVNGVKSGTIEAAMRRALRGVGTRDAAAAGRVLERVIAALGKPDSRGPR